MAREIVVASTTDTEEAVKAAAAGKPPEPEESKAAPPEPKEAPKEKPVEAKVEGEEAPEEKGRPKGNFQKRIDKLTAEKYRLSDELGVLRAKLETATKPAEEAAAAEPARPKPEDYEDSEKYLEALADWKTELKVKELKEKDAQEAIQQQMRKTFDAHLERTRKFREEHDDYDEVAADANIPIPKAVEFAIIELDNGPEVAYHLAKNPELAEKLAGMSDLAAVMEIGRLSASLAVNEKGVTEPSASAENPAPEKTKAVSAAPKPIKPVGAGATKSSVPLDETDYQTYKRLREEGRTS